MRKLALTAVALVAFGSQLKASVIIHEVGSVAGYANLDASSAHETSWTQTSSFSQVSITAPFENGSYQAYLTNQIGPGTTVANEVASGTFSVSGQPAFQGEFVTVFSNLTLRPGTYYLVVGATAGNSAGWDLTETDILPVLAPGVTAGLNGFCSRSGYLPASNFATIGGGNPLIFEVDSTPEPSTLVLLGSSLLAFAFRRRRLSE